MHNGLCNRHYLQMRRKGRFYETSREPRPVVIEGAIAKIPLGLNAKDGYATVDKHFAHLAKDNWRKTHWGYAIRSQDKKLLHRVITECPPDKVVDHINGDPLDCRTNNIRICAQSENAKNQKRRSNNTSGYKGVYRDNRGKFISRIKANYRNFNAGSFDTALEASRAYDIAAIKLHGEFARLNHG